MGLKKRGGKKAFWQTLWILDTFYSRREEEKRAKFERKGHDLYHGRLRRGQVRSAISTASARELCRTCCYF